MDFRPAISGAEIERKGGAQMEELMEVVFGLIVVAAAFAAKMGKQKATTKKYTASHTAAGNVYQATEDRPQIKAAAPAARVRINLQMALGPRWSIPTGLICFGTSA